MFIHKRMLKKLLIIILFVIFYNNFAHSFSSFGKYKGEGDLKLPKETFDILEFYLSGGKYGIIANNPKYDWEKKLKKMTNWKGMFFIVSKNGKGIYWYYNQHGDNVDTSPNYLGKAVGRCRSQGHGECYVFAIKNKIVWQNGINHKKGTNKKKKEARNGMVLTKLKELGFYDGVSKNSNTKSSTKSSTPKITKKKEDNDIVKKLKELNELYNSGVLTKEEFDKAKKKLLN